jgi:hypothetical protein
MRVMQTLAMGSAVERARLYRLASVLALITIFYNLGEGLVSVFFGLEDETVALFGFGLDSFVEVISGLGIWHMVRRVRNHGTDSDPDRFERTASSAPPSGLPARPSTSLPVASRSPQP